MIDQNEINRRWTEIHRQLIYLKDAGVKSVDIDRAFESLYFKDCERKSNFIYFEHGKN